MSVHVVQLTDLHLFRDPSTRLKGVPTHACFDDVLEHRRRHLPEPDLLVLTGDLAHDEQLQTYKALRGMLGPLVTRCRLIPGNHDSRPYLREVFPELTPPGDGPVTFSVSLGDWHLIGLDSHDPGKVSGRLAYGQIDWLKHELTTHRDRPTIVFLHHPPISVASAWLEPLLLHEPRPFLDLIDANGQVRYVSFGHIHQEFESRRGSVRLVATPSTAVQFTPRAAALVCDPMAPGYRVFSLDGDQCQTEVVRLPNLKYPPEAS